MNDNVIKSYKDREVAIVADGWTLWKDLQTACIWEHKKRKQTVMTSIMKHDDGKEWLHVSIFSERKQITCEKYHLLLYIKKRFEKSIAFTII